MFGFGPFSDAPWSEVAIITVSAVTEAGTAHDSPSVKLASIPLSVVETRHIKDAESDRFPNASQTITEAGAARDAVFTSGSAITGGITFWGYDYAAGKTLAVWCAGLDCGDHVVAANGSVFVPWQSDPDGLFTPSYLIAVSNSPPAGGFGPSACNIDLSFSSSLIRVVVDLAIGFTYTSQLQTLRPDVPELSRTPTGPGLAEKRRAHQFGLQLVNSGPPSVGGDFSNLLQVAFKTTGDNAYLLSQPYSGVWWDTLNDDYSFEGQIAIQITRPYPLVITRLGTFLQTAERNAQERPG